jgi:NitT/TauT family transport system substrate-binding protein
VRTAIVARLTAVVMTLSWVTAARCQDQVNVAMASGGYLYISVMTADALGYFKAENIDANIYDAGSGTKAMSQLAAGQAQFGLTAPPSGFLARQRGIDIQTVGAAITQYASNIVASKKFSERTGVTRQSAIDQKLNALKGSTFGVSTPGSGTEQIFRYLAKRAGINVSKDMTIATLGSGAAMLPAFSRDQIDGFSFSPPNPDVAVQKFGGFLLFDFAHGEMKELDGFLYQGVLVHQNWAEKNEIIVVHFLSAMQRALDVIHDDASTDKARDAVWQKWFNKTDKALYDRVWADMRSAFPKTVEVNADQMQRISDFSTAIGGPLQADTIKAGWTNKYAAQAVTAVSKSK